MRIDVPIGIALIAGAIISREPRAGGLQDACAEISHSNRGNRRTPTLDSPRLRFLRKGSSDRG
jgi:hypothetical protein